MLFHALEMALQNYCTISFDCSLTVRSVRVTQPHCQDDRLIAVGYGRTVEEALALANENYAFYSRGIPMSRNERPRSGSLEPTSPLDAWVLLNRLAWIEPPQNGRIRLRLASRDAGSSNTFGRNIPEVIEQAFRTLPLPAMTTKPTTRA